MGLSLSISGIPGKSLSEVVIGLREYLSTVDGGIEQVDIARDHKNFCDIQQTDGNTTVFYPPYFLKVDECSRVLSEILKCPVFSFDIYDGDFWAYSLFVDGKLEDRFMPIPDYFDEEISKEEIESWKGNPDTLVKYIPGLTKESIEKYLIRWNLDEEETKAYEDDEFTNCEYQLIDFLRKLKLPYPTFDEDSITGEIYKFWSKDIPLLPEASQVVSENRQANPNRPISEIIKGKPWWKFW